ncbi:MAG: HD domain-containing protein [Patescibacteria group bacterium]|jgi:uncharacterized protein
MQISKDIIRQIEKEARKYFIGASGCHDWTHIERTRNLALRIGKKEKADLQILEIAALLHDVGRKEEMKAKGKFCHAQRSAEIAEKFLRKLKINENDIKNILHCIICHRYRNEHIPQTLEAKVLFDADKLDSIGAVGIGRDFLFAGSAGSNTMYTGNEKKIIKDSKAKDCSFTKEDSAIMEYEYKLKDIKNKLLTKEGKKIGEERHRFMTEFFKRFWEEVLNNK